VASSFARLLPPLPRAALRVAAVPTLVSPRSRRWGRSARPSGRAAPGLAPTGYLSLSLLPLLAAASLRARARTVALAAGLVTSACLLGTVPADAVSGALQRAGFLCAHLWLAGLALGRMRA
jgi:hypothetical protein